MSSKARIFCFPLVVLALCSGLAGCDRSGTEPSAEPDEPESAAATPEARFDSLQDYEWQLESFGAGSAAEPLIEGTTINLRFLENGVIAGRSGCNNYRTVVEIGEQGETAVGLVASTMMACAPEIMDQEHRYFRKLDQTARLEMADDRLSLLAEDGRVILSFVGVELEES